MEQTSPSEQKKLDLVLETLEENLVPFDTIARYVYQNLEGTSPDGCACPPPEAVRGAMLLHIQNLMKVIDICRGKI